MNHKPKNRGEARTKIANVFKGNKPFTVAEMKSPIMKLPIQDIVKIKIYGNKLDPKTRNRFEKIIAKKYNEYLRKHPEIVTKVASQCADHILNP